MYFFSDAKNSRNATAYSATLYDLQNLLKSSFVIGERHFDITPKKFLILNMAALKEAGFTTLFLEGLPTTIQEKLDRFISSNDVELDPEVQIILTEMDQCLPLQQIRDKILEGMDEDSEHWPLKNFRKELILNAKHIDQNMKTICDKVEKDLIRASKIVRLHREEKEGKVSPLIKQVQDNNYTQVVLAAKKNGIRIIAMDSQEMLQEGSSIFKSSLYIDRGGFVNKRVKEGNAFFSSVIENNLPIIGEKWVALMGEEHAKNSEHQGIAQRFNVGSLYFKTFLNEQRWLIERVDNSFSSTAKKAAHFCIITTSQYDVPRFCLSFLQEMKYKMSNLSLSSAIGSSLLYLGENLSHSKIYNKFFLMFCAIDNFLFRSNFMKHLDQVIIEKFLSKGSVDDLQDTGLSQR
ncbi:MAG: hypothetical protein QM652_05815 [Legionella sp.]|uniref:hypothetical protein n=1 Tax=Legionella sp. TaxID=459 RepID=UPI0039E4195D